MEIDISKQPVHLGSWLTAEPKNGDDSWLAWGVFNGAADMVQTYAIEAARIRATSEYNEYANPALKKQAALQSFAKTLLAARTARYQESLDRVASAIAANERELTKGRPRQRIATGGDLELFEQPRQPGRSKEDRGCGAHERQGKFIGGSRRARRLWVHLGRERSQSLCRRLPAHVQPGRLRSVG